MHSHDHSHSYDQNKPGGINNAARFFWVILLNVIITVAEYIGGILSGSLALISDAGHNLSDVLSLMLGYIGQKVSAREPGSRYTFGLKRFEVLIALVNALGLLFIGGYIVVEAIQRYNNPVPIQPGIMIPIAFIGLAGNVFSILVLHGSRKDNLNMKAAFLHLLYDAISSVAVIITGVVVLFTGWMVLDLVVSLVIVFMIVWSSMEILRDAVRIFMQGVPRHIDPEKVYQGILNIPQVSTVHGLHIWSVSSTEIFLSCHICVDAEPGTVDTDQVINDVNTVLDHQFGIRHTTLQVENVNLCHMNGGSCCR
ncbi:MAG: cation diffusion facilitator family transporter [Spirochaetota bacterium]